MTYILHACMPACVKSGMCCSHAKCLATRQLALIDKISEDLEFYKESQCSFNNNALLAKLKIGSVNSAYFCKSMRSVTYS